MSQLDDAISRYNKLLENGPYRDLGWVDELHKRMEQEHLSAGGRLICPFLRPNFITRRQYDSLVKTGEALISAIDRMQRMVLASPTLLARMELLPAEKMLAAIDPGYQVPEVAARLDSHVNNGTLRVVQYNADSPSGAAYTEVLADLFYDSPPVKEFRKRYHLTRVGGKRHLLGALLKAYKQFGGHKKPNIAILEFRPAYHAGQSEYELFRDFFREEGYSVEIVSPDQLEYRNKILRKGPFEIDLVYRRISVQEFLMRFDLTHPLVRAYRERTVCVVNSFRSELAHKKAMFGLLTDDVLTAKFPATERKAIHDHVPWTRMVTAGKTTYNGETIDLLEFIAQNREKLVLKPNDDYSDLHSFFGWDMDETAWDRALKQAQRAPYVVQERVAPVRAVFPMMTYGQLEFKDMQVDVHPHAYLGKVLSCSSWLSTGQAGFSSLGGLVPTFILDSKS
ncbi:MAG TPA: circularly permuted type 2 ATP-grasp protein [Bryobacteraceae bacterium]|nr:circularly permuted type 2 ATP-grasp protein [Bryobacteraceae bacterium]